MTRDTLRNAASTLAHHWENNSGIDRIGVERLIDAYPPAHQRHLCALVLSYLEQRGAYTSAMAFESMLYDAAVCPC